MNQEQLYRILLSPHISEKSTGLSDKHKHFVFKVATEATKTQIKQAVERLFNTQVESVQVLNVKGKTKRFKNILGKRKSWKKAFVQLAAGQDIQFAADMTTHR